MGVFAYKAKSVEGKVVKGKIESISKVEALNELSKMDLVVFEVEPMNTILNKDIYIGAPLKDKDFTIFLRQFATLMEAGLLLIDALDLLAKQASNRILNETLEEVSAEVKGGVTLSSALAHHPKVFPKLLIHMIEAAEISGKLEETLDQMATYYEKQYRIKQKVTTAMTYPMVVGSLAVLITIFLLVFIVPMFAAMFESMGEELPAITLMILGLSTSIQRFWWIFTAAILGFVIVFLQLRKNEKIAYQLDVMKLKVPVFGMFTQKTILARMTQTLSSLINSSVPILDAIDVTSQVVGNRVVEKVLLEARDAVEQGESLSKPLSDHWAFPPLISQMIQVGESSGALDDTLKKIATIYDQEVEEASDRLQSLIEPLMIIFLSIIVGAIVLAIVIPMFGLFESF